MQDGSQQPWLTLRVIPASAMSMTVFKLHPDMLYQFMVLSPIHVGDGLFSEIVASRTKGTHNFYVGYTGGDQSMEKSVFYGILSLILVYRPNVYLWTLLRIFLDILSLCVVTTTSVDRYLNVVKKL